MSFEHWRYFLVLEQDLEATTRYVEPAPANFKAFSIEFARLLLGTCSEIDVVAKVLCQKANPDRPANNIDDYRLILTEKYPRFHTIVVHTPRFNLKTSPWRAWGDGANPEWWREHNKVKHMRHENFALANLHNCIAAATGLYALLLYLYQEDLFALRLDPNPSLFRIEKQPVKIVHGNYELPDFGAAAG